MADVRKLVVLKRLTALIESAAITPYAGVDLPLTLAGVVYRGRSLLGVNEDTIGVSILEAPRHLVFSQNNEIRYGEWSLMISGWSRDDVKHPTDLLYGMSSDVERVLDRITACRSSDGSPKYPNDYYLGQPMADDAGANYLIDSFKLDEPVVRPPTENVSSKSFFYFIARVGLARSSG